MATMDSIFDGYDERKEHLVKSTNPFAKGVAWIEGELVPLNEAHVPLMDQGFHYGDLTYDVPAVWDGRFFRVDDHLDRFATSCAKMRMQFPVPREEMRRTLIEMVARSGIRDAFVEMIVTRGMKGVREIVQDEEKPEQMQNLLYMFVCPYVWVMRPEVQRFGGRAIVASTVRRVPPGAFNPTIKNLQWGDFTRGMFEAMDRDAEVPFLSDGDANLTEGAGFNIVLVKEGIMYTPDRGCLEGVTRKSVFDAAKVKGIEVRCEIVPAALAYHSDEIFMCTTAGGIMPITTMDGRLVRTGAIGPVTQAIWDEYWRMHWDDQYCLEIPYGEFEGRGAGWNPVNA